MHMRNITLAALLVGLLATLGACASSGETVRRDGNRITNEELVDVQVSTLYEAVERLRPRWLTVRAPRSFGMTAEILVYQEQTLLGNIDVLRQLSKDAAYSLRYMDGPTASASLPGTSGRHIEGAIVIQTARPSR
jgi:hypothetical protein